MACLLDPQHTGILERFAQSNVLVALDYDGTLAPIVAAPQRARMRLMTRRLLTSLARCYPCVVISGRTLDDIGRRVSSSAVWGVFGNHGFEPSDPDQRYVRRVREWVAQLRWQLEGEDGVTIEDKTYTATIHYRRAGDPSRARLRIREAVGGLVGARIIEGTAAVNLLPQGGPDKGAALRAAQRRFECETAIYVGDDETDEPAFSIDDSTRLLSVRIGRSETSAALYYLERQSDIDFLLGTLVWLRREWLACDPIRLARQ